MQLFFLVIALIAAISVWLRARQTDGQRVTPAIARYGAGFVAAWLLANLGLYALQTSGVRPSASGTLTQKMAHYRAHADEYTMIFVGDSRTYCAMHPDLIDPALGTRSLNLARWANWFPTQYAQFQDLAPLVPESTVVVWSIGHQNFRPVEARIHTAYPLGLRRVPNYLRLGYSLDSLADNLLFHHPATTLIGWSPQLRVSLERQLSRVALYPPVSGAGVGSQPHETTPEILLARHRPGPRPARWDVRRDGGRITSLEVEKDNGAYERIELDSEFFRDKQRAHASRLAQRGVVAPFEPSPEYWKSFLAILDLFQAEGIRLVVNELEEAPHVYVDDEQRARLRRFMSDSVAPEVRRRGFAYVRADLDALTDADYFDYNHLNHRGARHYAQLLVPRLRSALDSR